jgi:hypothetical protein
MITAIFIACARVRREAGGEPPRTSPTTNKVAMASTDEACRCIEREWNTEQKTTQIVADACMLNGIKAIARTEWVPHYIMARAAKAPHFPAKCVNTGSLLDEYCRGLGIRVSFCPMEC